MALSFHGGLVTQDGPVHGAWKQIGPRLIKARTLYFAFDPAGFAIWIARPNGELRFNDNFASGAGTLTVERFQMDQDPLDPTAIPHDRDLHRTPRHRRLRRQKETAPFRSARHRVRPRSALVSPLWAVAPRVRA